MLAFSMPNSRDNKIYKVRPITLENEVMIIE